jgi:uncharacterized protein with ParB-like and HNH nuclease domain
MKKVIILFFSLLVLVACTAKEESEAQKIYSLMITAKEEGRALTQEEMKRINDFYLYKPLKERGTELDYTLQQMFYNFNNPGAFEEFRKRAEKALKEEG